MSTLLKTTYEINALAVELKHSYIFFSNALRHLRKFSTKDSIRKKRLLVNHAQELKEQLDALEKVVTKGKEDIDVFYKEILSLDANYDYTFHKEVVNSLQKLLLPYKE